MKKTFLLLLTIASVTASHAQISLFNKKKKTENANTKSDTTHSFSGKPEAIVLHTSKKDLPKKDWSKVDLSKRTADHFMMQLGYNNWAGTPDSIRVKGFGRFFNFYFMIDKPFKTDPHFSWGLGLGFASSNIYFDKQRVDVKSTGNRLAFPDMSAGDFYKKSKLTTIFFEAPIELRYYADPEHPNKSFKAALGAKLGVLLKSYAKNKNLENQAGQSYYGSSYVVKESDSRLINGTKAAVTGRIGYGLISLMGDFQITQVIKSGFGPGLNPYSIGITIIGL
jgi:hypothetical protein